MGISLMERFENLIFPNQVYLMAGSKELFKSLKMGSDPYVIRTVSRDKNFVYQVDHFGRTLLHWATRRSNINVVKQLLFSGAYVCAIDFYDYTPLDYAVKNNDLEMVAELLKCDARPFIKALRDDKSHNWANFDTKVMILIKNARHIWISSMF